MGAAKALAPEPSLLDNAISTAISCSGQFNFFVSGLTSVMKKSDFFTKTRVNIWMFSLHMIRYIWNLQINKLNFILFCLFVFDVPPTAGSFGDGAKA